MAHLTVYFVGICSHLREFTSRDTEHRVVLVDARDGREINGRSIGAHSASLLHGDKQTIDLKGLHVTVPNAASAAIAYDRSFFKCIPRLTAYAPSLPSLSLSVVKDGDPDFVAAYFDAPGGRFMAGVNEKASVAVLEIETTSNPVLHFKNLPGNNRTPIPDLELPDRAKIQIQNIGPGRAAGEKEFDFLLNFLVAQFVSSDATWPTEAASCGQIDLPFPINTVDPGCSNSNYP